MRPDGCAWSAPRARREGVRLPASRALASELGVSRGVVTDVYEQLAAQGFLIVRARAAPVVATTLPGPASRPRERRAPAPAPRYDLTPTTPDVTLFPLNRWLATAQQAARRAGAPALDYREPRGERVLREALADHLGRTRGVIADPEQIVIVQGTAQGADLLLRMLRARGAARIAVEDPSHTTQHERARAFGLLSGERRRRLLAWAEGTGGLVVEDDYDSEFRYDREPVRAMQGLAPSRVVSCGAATTIATSAARAASIARAGTPSSRRSAAISPRCESTASRRACTCCCACPRA